MRLHEFDSNVNSYVKWHKQIFAKLQTIFPLSIPKQMHAKNKRFNCLVSAANLCHIRGQKMNRSIEPSNNISTLCKTVDSTASAAIKTIDWLPVVASIRVRSFISFSMKHVHYFIAYVQLVSILSCLKSGFLWLLSIAEMHKMSIKNHFLK